MDSNIENCCRICLDVKTEHFQILDDPTITLHIKSCLAVTISSDDELPKAICSSCVAQLNEFYNFQLNARCSQDWLETALEEKKKATATKVQIQPLPDSEYNSDSLLEFLNNTANIEEYLNSLGKEDIPSIVTLFDGNEHFNDNHTKPTKVSTPKKKENLVKHINISSMDIDNIDPDIDLVKGVLTKKLDPKSIVVQNDKMKLVCFACKLKFTDIHKLAFHMAACDNALRTCVHCNILFDSKFKLQQHILTHKGSMLYCNCGEQFQNIGKLAEHQKTCFNDYGAALGCVYSCKECHKTFKEKLPLIRHAREHVHESQKRKCDMCSHSFIGNEALSKHKLNEHAQSSNLSYRCKVCNFKSLSHNEMYLHVRNHTALPKSNLHLCESCGHSFATYTSLSRHRLQHINSQNYQCNVCLKYISDKKQLEKHMQIHEHMIMCERCGETVNSVEINVHSCN